MLRASLAAARGRLDDFGARVRAHGEASSLLHGTLDLILLHDAIEGDFLLRFDEHPNLARQLNVSRTVVLLSFDQLAAAQDHAGLRTARGPAFRVHRFVDVRAGFQEYADRVWMAFADGKEQWREATVQGRPKIGARLEQQVDHIDVSLGGSPHDGALAAFFGRIHIGAGAHEQHVVGIFELDEHLTEHHHHLICRECGAVTEFRSAELDEAIEREAGLARFCDVFMEPGVFDAAHTRRILRAGLEHGLIPKLHADELENSGGAELAAALGAASADHLGAISDEGIAALAASDTVATLLPGTLFFLGKQRYAPARKLLDAGATVALATDFNPGSSASPNLPLILTMACSQMRMDPLGASELGELAGNGLGLERSTPLWYYVLKEARLRANGATLGPVGARIVGEVFVGLLSYDDQSYLTQDPLWKPTLPTLSGSVTGEFRMIDFLAFAGVDPLSRARGGPASL